MLTMPASRIGRAFATLLCVTILCASGAVAFKWVRNAGLERRWAWAATTERFPGAAVDRAGLKQFADHDGHTPAKLGKPVKATFKVDLMADSPWCKTAHTSDGDSWTFALTVQHLDVLHFGGAAGTGEGAGVTVGAGACGGNASMGFVKSAWGTWAGGAWVAPADWSDDEKAAWTLWATSLPAGTYGVSLAYGFLYAATVSAGAETATIYKCFGYADIAGPPPPYPPPTVRSWYGPTDWTLGGSFSIANLRLRMQKQEAAVGAYNVPRRWKDFTGNFGWFVETDPSKPTTTVATLGDMTVSHIINMAPDPVTGAIDVDTTPVNPASFGSSITYGGGTVNVNTDYGLVSGITCSGAAPNCHNSFYSTDGASWTATTTVPEGVQWHAFNAGNTMCLQRMGSQSSATFGWHTWMRGPIYITLNVGRGGHGEFAAPAGWRADMGLVHYLNDDGSETEPVWLGPGSHGPFVAGMTTRDTDATGLWTDAIMFSGAGGHVDHDWLVSSGELCAAGGEDTPLLDNSQVKMVLPSLQEPLAGNYWGPVLNVVHNNISADIPPGETERPSPWAAGTGVTIDVDHNERWTITGDTGQLTRTLLSRYDARLGYLAGGYAVGGTPYISDWIMVAKANWLLDSDPAEVAAVCEKEDVTNYDNSRCLVLTFADGYPAGLPAGWQKDAVLKLDYRTYTFTDECYTPAQYDGTDLRFGTDGEFTFDSSDASFEFTGDTLTTADTSTGLKFDLGQMRRVQGTDLRHCTKVTLTLPAGEFHLSSMMLQQDPDSRTVPLVATTDVQFTAQPATDPWNWLGAGMGFGGTYQGVPCLNVPEGTEGTPFNRDIQWGIKQTQYLQWNPYWLEAQEEPPTYDPTAGRDLNVRMVQLIQRQEQFSNTSLGGEVEAACSDDEGNSLGFLYPWDLRRLTSDDNSGLGAIHVGSLNDASAPLCPITMTGIWIGHGRAQGIAFQKGKFVRGLGGSWDNAATGRAKLYRRAIDDTGAPTGGWSPCGSMTPDLNARWISPPQQEMGFEYGTKTTATSTTPESVSQFRTREYADLYCYFPGGPGKPAMDMEGVRGTVHLAYVKDDLIRYTQSCPYLDETTKFPGFRYGNLAPVNGTVQSIAVFDAGEWDNPSVVTMPTRDLYVSAVDKSVTPHVVSLKKSQNQGATWEAVTLGTFLAGLTQCSLTQHKGVLSLAGVTGGNVVYRRSDDGGVNAAKLAGGGVGSNLGAGTVMSANITAAEDEQPDIVIDPTGAVYVACNTGSEISLQVSRDGGNTWAEAQVVT